MESGGQRQETPRSSNKRGARPNSHIRKKQRERASASGDVRNSEDPRFQGGAGGSPTRTRGQGRGGRASTDRSANPRSFGQNSYGSENRIVNQLSPLRSKHRHQTSTDSSNGPAYRSVSAAEPRQEWQPFTRRDEEHFVGNGQGSGGGDSWANSSGQGAHIISITCPPGVDPQSNWQPPAPRGQRWVEDDWEGWVLEPIPVGIQEGATVGAKPKQTHISDIRPNPPKGGGASTERQEGESNPSVLLPPSPAVLSAPSRTSIPSPLETTTRRPMTDWADQDSDSDSSVIHSPIKSQDEARTSHLVSPAAPSQPLSAAATPFAPSPKINGETGQSRAEEASRHIPYQPATMIIKTPDALLDFDDMPPTIQSPVLSPSLQRASANGSPLGTIGKGPPQMNGLGVHLNGIGSDLRVSQSGYAPSQPRSETSSDQTEGAHSAAKNGSRRPTRQLARKASSPMMPAFMVSAPGKVIVFGEHAVVHGKSAVAASISLRSYLLVTSLSKSKRTVQLRFPDIKLDHTWNIDELPWSEFSAPGKKKSYYDLVTELDPELLESLQHHLNVVSPDIKDEMRRIHRAAASGFLYLFLSLGSQSFPPTIYTLRSTIPIGAGLGSSATTAVCLATALLLQIRALSGPHPDQPEVESALQLERINRWAFVGELCIHGNPSGVDNTVSSHGKAVLFNRSDYQKPPTVIPVKNFPELPLLIIDTKQSRSTAMQVGKVGTMKKARPSITNAILDTIHNVTEDALASMGDQSEIITNGEGHRYLANNDATEKSDGVALTASNTRKLGELMRINHGLLVSLSVSHPKLERIRAIIDHPTPPKQHDDGRTGYGYTKLTGAGGGGCAISLIDPATTPAEKQMFSDQLRAEGFEIFETSMGGAGVGVLWPAVLKNKGGARGTESEEEEEAGGEEISMEKFLSVEGTEGVERLVGVWGGEEGGRKREEWKYWRN